MSSLTAYSLKPKLPTPSQTPCQKGSKWNLPNPPVLYPFCCRTSGKQISLVGSSDFESLFQTSWQTVGLPVIVLLLEGMQIGLLSKARLKSSPLSLNLFRFGTNPSSINI